MSAQGDAIRNLAEAYDNMSEAARTAADAAHDAALRGISPDKRRRLTDAMGGATSNEARVAAVAKLYKRCVDLAEEVEGEFGLSQAALNEINLLANLLHQLMLVWQFELLRDTYRAIAASFD